MIYQKDLVGYFIKLRSALVSDAEFILRLRLDTELNKFIGKTEDDISMQRNWIFNQQHRKGDYYFVITDLIGNPLGTISLYGISNNQGEFGRWISNGNAIQNLESAIMLHDFGFDVLGLNLIFSNTVVDNKKVINFHKRFGATLLEDFHEDDQKGFTLQRGEIHKPNYEIIRLENMKILKRFL